MACSGDSGTYSERKALSDFGNDPLQSNPRKFPRTRQVSLEGEARFWPAVKFFPTPGAAGMSELSRAGGTSGTGDGSLAL